MSNVIGRQKRLPPPAILEAAMARATRSQSAAEDLIATAMFAALTGNANASSPERMLRCNGGAVTSVTPAPTLPAPRAGDVS